MTPESVLKAMAEALAEKYTTDGRPGADQRAHERLNEGMMRHFREKNGFSGMAPVTPREAAVEAMNVVGPVLELVFRMKEAMEALAKSHKEFIDEWARHDADAHTVEVQHVAESLVREVEVQEPADWDYVRRFSATPSEIDGILRSGLAPVVYDAYKSAVKSGEFD